MKTFHKKSQVFDNYTILQNLGKGVGGRIFKAKHKTTGKVVILKVKRVQNLANLDTFRKRIQDQFELLKAIPASDHKNLVQYYDVLCIKYNKYAEIIIIMEYVEGENLYEVMEAMDVERHSVSVREAMMFMESSFKILDELHSRNIVHRDVKPENWMVSPQGLKLVDFDLVCLDYSKKRKYPRALMHQGLTCVKLPNSLVCDYTTYPGTTIYFSPELLQASVANLKDPSHLDAKSIEVWAEGVVVLDLLMRGIGEDCYVPTLRATPNIVDGHHVGGRYLVIAKFLRSERMTKTMRVFRPLIMRILATNPKHRPSTREILQELDDIKKKNVVLFG